MELSHDYKNSILRNRKLDPDKEKKKKCYTEKYWSGQILFPITVENCCEWFGYSFNKNKNRSICLSNSFFSTAIVSCIEKPLKKRLPFDRSENRTKKKIEDGRDVRIREAHKQIGDSKVSAETWSLHFLSSPGHRERFHRPSSHRESARILSPGRCGRYTCRSPVFFPFCGPGRTTTLFDTPCVQYPAPLAILPFYGMLNFGNLPFMKSMIHDEYVTGWFKKPWYLYNFYSLSCDLLNARKVVQFWGFVSEERDTIHKLNTWQRDLKSYDYLYLVFRRFVDLSFVKILGK